MSMLALVGMLATFRVDPGMDNSRSNNDRLVTSIHNYMTYLANGEMKETLDILAG
mgnify:CR=1 FL=1